MPVMKLVSLILVLVALVMGTRHGIKLIRSTTQQVQADLQLLIGRKTILALALTTLASVLLLLVPQTFIVGNALAGAVIIYLVAAQLNAGNFRAALVESFFLAPPLLLAYLGYPLTFSA